MSTEGVRLIVAAFDDVAAAETCLENLAQARQDAGAGVLDAALVRRDENNKLQLKELKDMKAGKGAAIGGVVGGLIGLIAGPVGWVALGGAALGGLMAKLRDSGFPDEKLKALGESLTPGTAAVVAVVKPEMASRVEAMLTERGATRLNEQLGEDLVIDLSDHRAAVEDSLSHQSMMGLGKSSTGDV